ncbi:MAG: DsrE family protein [Gammaproteobacteria bacterium]|nr:DsrE family protein [Gammaproteobacteria bacterium]
MNQEQKFSDEFLNAFVDDQLAPEEKGRAYLSINNDDALNRQVCELRKMRDLVQLAYKDLSGFTAPGPRAGRPGNTIAAGFILAFGIALGWLLHQPGPAPEATPVAALPAAGSVPPAVATHKPPAVPPAAKPLVVAGNEVKVLFHLSSDKPERIQEVLDEAEALLKFYRAAGQIARVQVITNGDGLNLLRTDKSPDPERVRAMLKTYDNLSFAACQNTIDRLKREQGVTAELLPGASVVDSGVAQIILRQQQGWIYIQV